MICIKLGLMTLLALIVSSVTLAVNDTSQQRRTILVVEDEESITIPLAEALERDGFTAEIAHTAADGISRGKTLRPDLVLFDIGLPDGSGLDVCRELRSSSNVPIIILSARGEEADRVVGLDLGADDYVVKPFSAREVIARIRAVLRPTAAPAAVTEGPIEIGEVRLDPARRTASSTRSRSSWRGKEFDLLALLMQEAGTVVSRERLIDEVWDVSWFGSTKTLDVHVSALRKKLDDDAADSRYIYTVRASAFASPRPRSFDEPSAQAARSVCVRAGARADRPEIPLVLSLSSRINAEVKSQAAAQAQVVATELGCASRRSTTPRGRRRCSPSSTSSTRRSRRRSRGARRPATVT